MIVEALLNVVISFLSAVFGIVEFPPLPDGVYEVLLSGVEVINAGLDLLGNFVDLPYLLTLFAVIVSVDLGVYLFKFIMFILRKLPMLGVE